VQVYIPRTQSLFIVRTSDLHFQNSVSFWTTHKARTFHYLLYNSETNLIPLLFCRP